MRDRPGPIAIVGMACRFPGSASTPDQFWELLRSGRDAMSKTPADRNGEKLYDLDPSSPGKVYVDRGGYIDNVEGFDAAFFTMSPREAVHVDPQQRLLLELAYEAFEDGGMPLEEVAGSRTGVFVGISSHDYSDVQVYPSNRSLIDGHSNSGSASSLAANRISYMYDLRGPSMMIDTACSSSLTALHLAMGSLRRGECDAAVVGGAQLLLTAELTIGFCKASMLSPDCRCAAFDASANGYVRSEGGGVVVLKPLEAALAAGDRVYAVVAGTAVNQDGHTLGMTVPSGAAQEAVVRAALADASIDPADVDYVEAHGTGTPVGDPIEANALGAVFGPAKGRDGSCAIGSVKTNIGHLEAASGVAGLCKVALSLWHGEVPRSLHQSTPNPDIDFDRLRLRVVTDHEPWPEVARRVAGVNSFGFGGANAHAVLTSLAPSDPAPVRAATPVAGGDSPALLLPLSARTPGALAATIRAVADHLAAPAAPDLDEVCRTAAVRRSHHEYRVAAAAGTGAEMAELLQAVAAGERRSAAAQGQAVKDGPPLAFVFSGMGPQWARMAGQLLHGDPVFAGVIARCDRALRDVTDWSLLHELDEDEATSRVTDADLCMVTNFAVQIGLFAVWEHWGVHPGAVFGHSAGEVAAACASGALELEAAVLIAWHRSRLQSRADGEGRMLAVGLARADAEELVAASGGLVCLAAVNGPASVTLSGNEETLTGIADELTQRQLFARFLAVGVPYHSSHMDQVHEEVLAALAFLRPRPARIPMVSAVTGAWVDGRDLTAAYWWRAIRQPVEFVAGIDSLVKSGYRTFLEIAAHPVLSQSIGECLAARQLEGTILPTLRRKQDDRATMLGSAGALWAAGVAVDWRGILGDGPDRARMPLYQWDRERHWFESRRAEAQDDAELDHPLLGRRVPAPTPLWESRLSGPGLRWLHDHVVQGSAIHPGAAYVETALAAARLLGDDEPAIRDVTFPKVLLYGDEPMARVQCAVIDGALSIHADHPEHATSDRWDLHVRARVSKAGPRPAPLDLDNIRSRCGRAVDTEDLYRRFRRRGLHFGPAFMGIGEVWQGRNEAIGLVTLPDVVADVDDYLVHPALLDAAFQTVLVAAETGGARDDELFVPVRIDRVGAWQAVGRSCWAHARVIDDGAADGREVVAAVDLTDEQGTVLVSVIGLRCRQLDERAAPAQENELLYELRWEMASEGAGPSVLSALPPAALDPVASATDRIAAEQGWDAYYGDIEPALDRAAAGLAWNALVEAGWTPDAGPIAEADMEATTSTVPARRRLLRALVEGMVAGGLLRRDGPLVVATGTPPPDPGPLLADLASDFPAFATDAALVAQSGAILAPVLQGRLDGASALFDDGGALLSHFYGDAPASRYSNTLVTEAVAAFVAGRQTDRPLHVLEVGGGTGGTTAHVRRALPAGSRYTFTDAAPRFVQAMAAEVDPDEVRTAVVDVERDLGPQGVTPEAHDVVIGANVVHATADVVSTLRHLGGTLAPGGRLVLVEITRPLPWLDVVFGITDGWWRFSDHDVRPSHALLSPHGWHDALSAAGFEGVTILADHPGSGPPGQCVLVATWPATQAATAGPSGPAGPATAAQQWSVRGDGPVADAVRDELAGRAALAGLEQADAVVLVATDGVPADTSCSAVDLLDRQLDGIEDVLEVLRSDDGSLPAAVCVVTGNAQAVGEKPGLLDLARAPLWGLVRVGMKEHPGVRWRLVDLPAAPGPSDVQALVDVVVGGDTEEENSLRNGRRKVRRLRRRPTSTPATHRREAGPTDAWRVEIDRPGALETCDLRFTTRRPPGYGEVEVEVDAAGLNFRDVVLAMGLLPTAAFEGTFGERALGLDVAGRVVAVGPGVDALRPGDHVFGIGPGSFASHVTTAAELLAVIPSGVSPASAAASPCAFVTALYSLERQARIAAGERVLIHSATGGVGLAALQVARRAGAEVFATAGSDEKRAMLRALGVEHVFDSRRLDFPDEVLEATGGAGVDIVLNSLTGEAIARGIATLAPFGRFIELGKRDIYDDATISLLAFGRNLSYFAVDLDRICRERRTVAGELLRQVAGLLADGALEPLPVTTFPVAETGAAIRLMAQARHVGKVVLEVAGTGPEIEVPVRRCRADGTYLVTGGTGGFGLATAAWLVGQGAGAVVVVARRPPDEATAARLAELGGAGATVVAMTADVGVEADVAAVLEKVRATLPPLRGVVHAAMVLDDGGLADLDRERLRLGMAAKVLGAWNLHQQTSHLELDMFVCYSSIAALLGNAGQGGYAAANAFLQALASHRRALGLAAHTVDWGVLSGVGYVARRPELGRHLERQGYRSFPPRQAFAALERLIDDDVPQGMAALMDWGRLASAGSDELSSSRLRHFAPAEGGDNVAATPVMARMLALPTEDRLAALVALLQSEIATVLGVGIDRVQVDRPLPDLGFDSLIAVELVTVLQLRLGVDLPIVKLLQDVTVRDLAALVLDLTANLTLPDAGAVGSEVVGVAAPDAVAVRPDASGVAASGVGRTVATAPAGVAARAGNGAGDRSGEPGGSADHHPDVDGGVARYERLDYRSWSPAQRAIKGTIGSALRMVAKVEVEGADRLALPGPYILASNHLAVIDVPLVLTLMPRPAIVLAGEKFQGNRLTNWFLADMGNAIYVDRGTGDTEALARALTVLRSGGIVGVSPEGRCSLSGALERAHTGVAYLAAQAGVPVVPLAAWGQEAIGSAVRRGRRAAVRIRVGLPMEPPPTNAVAADLISFSTDVMVALATMLPEAYRGVYAGRVPPALIGSGA